MASIKKVSQTAKSLGAAGFVVAVEDSYPGTKFDPVPVNIPGILITDVSKTKVFSFDGAYCADMYRQTPFVKVDVTCTANQPVYLFSVNKLLRSQNLSSHALELFSNLKEPTCKYSQSSDVDCMHCCYCRIS